MGSVWATIRQPSDGDLGEVEAGHFKIEHGIVVLVDRDGRELRGPRGGGYRQKILEGEDARQAAKRLVRDAYFDRHGSDFNRPLHYAPLSIA